MAGEGKILREAREKMGWTYHDIEEITKIRVRYLEALENEQYDVLPGIAYTKGFLRTYSKHVGLDPDQIIQSYDSSIKVEPIVETSRTLTPIQSTPVWFKPMVLLVMAVFAAGIVFGIIYFSKINETPQTSDYKPTPMPTAPQTPKPTPDQNTPSEPSSQQEEQPPAVYEGIVAELMFKQDCWLKVKVDGVLVEDGMNAAGTTKVLQGTNRIEFMTIGNAGGVSIKLNGKQVPPLGKSKEVVWNYVVTEETIKDL